MKLNNNFDIAKSPEEAWQILLDVPRIAPCLPGAELTETIGENQYKGNAGVKLGPVQLKFAGEAKLTDVNAEERTAQLKAKGNDSKGRGSANATVEFRLTETETGTTRVDLDTDLNLAGSIAQYGRATGLIEEIARQLVSDFADNLSKQLAQSEVKTADTKKQQTRDMPAAQSSVSGFSLLFRAIAAMFRRMFSKAH